MPQLEQLRLTIRLWRDARFEQRVDKGVGRRERLVGQHDAGNVGFLPLHASSKDTMAFSKSNCVVTRVGSVRTFF